MNDNAYTPIPGTTAYLVIEHLKTLTPGSEISVADACRAIGRAVDGFTISMATATREGFVRKRNAAGRLMWSLGPSSPGFSHAHEKPTDDSQQVLSASALASPSVFAYAAQRGAAPFSASLSTDGRLSIERNGRLVLELTNDERALVAKAAIDGVSP